MAGGVYHDHADMEVLLDLGTLSATTEPITDAGMDAITVMVEAYAGGMVRAATGSSLSDCASTSERKGLLMSMSAKYFKAQQNIRSGADSRSTPSGSVTYSMGGANMSNEIYALIGMASQSGSIFYTIKGVDETKNSGRG